MSDQISFSLIDPSDGRAIRFHFDEFMIKWVSGLAEKLLDHDYFVELANYVDKDLLQLHLEQSVYIEVLEIARTLFRRTTARNMGMVWEELVYSSSDLTELVMDNWPDESRFLLKRRAGLKGYLRYLKEKVFHARVMLWKRMYSRGIKSNSNQNKIGVELVEGSDPHKKSEAFWLANGAVQAERVVFLLEPEYRKYINPDKEYEFINKIGAAVLALHPSMRRKGKIPFWAPEKLSPWVYEYKRTLRSPCNKLEKWLRHTLLQGAIRVSYWEQLFTELNIVVYQQFSELSKYGALKRMALLRVGGVEVGKMRSQFFDISSSAFYFQHDIVFAWQGNAVDALEYGRSRAKEVCQVGYIYGHLIEEKKKLKSQLRDYLEKHGVEVIIVAFDNQPHINGHFDEGQLKDFYATLAAVVNENKKVGLIIKSKKPEILKWFKSIQKVVNDLSSVERCIIINERFSSVIDSALAADIAVGFPALTAVCEAAMCGCRPIMYDPSGTNFHELSGDDIGVIFHDIESFAEALKSAINNDSGDWFKDNGAILGKLDAFRDGKAYLRAAHIINRLLGVSS